MEGRAVSDQNSLISFLSLKLCHGSLVDLIHEQVVLDATHAHSKLDQLADEKRQGSQRVFDEVQDGNHCESDIQAQRITKANIEREDDSLQDLREKVQIRDNQMADSHTTPEQL